MKQYCNKKIRSYKDIFAFFLQCWVLDIINEIRPKQKRWRPQTDNTLLFKIYILQMLNNWSDPQTEKEITTNITYWAFLEINPVNQEIPDESTICRFRELLRINWFQEICFNLVIQELKKLWILDTDIVMLDSTIIESAKSTKNKTFSRDPEMQSTCKRWTWYFWMKAHILTSSKALVCNLISTPANIFDWNMSDELINSVESCSYVFGDSWYISKERIEQYEKLWITCMFCEKWYKNHPLTPEQRHNNRIKSWIRAKVEHPFCKLKCKLGFRKARFKWIYKNHLQLCFAFTLINIMTVKEEILNNTEIHKNIVNMWLFSHSFNMQNI